MNFTIDRGVGGGVGAGVGAGVQTVMDDVQMQSVQLVGSVHTPSLPVPGASVSVDIGVPEQFGFCQSCATPPEVHVVPLYLTETSPRLPVMQAPGDVM